MAFEGLKGIDICGCIEQVWEVIYDFSCDPKKFVLWWPVKVKWSLSSQISEMKPVATRASGISHQYTLWAISVTLYNPISGTPALTAVHYLRIETPPKGCQKTGISLPPDGK